MTNYNFTETPNTTGKVIDTITLTANDYLSFPTFFVDKHKLKGRGETLYAKLFFDKANMAIAIQFDSEKKPGLYKLNVSPKYGATCKIKSFLLNNEIDVRIYTNKYEYVKHKAGELGLEGQDVYVIDLNSKNKDMPKESDM